MRLRRAIAWLALAAAAAAAPGAAEDAPPIPSPPAAAPGTAPAASDKSREARQLDALRHAIDERRDRVARFEREQRGLLEALEAIDRAVAELEADAVQRQRDAEAASARVHDLEARLPDLEERLARARRAMSARVVALYKTGELGPAQVLFAAESLRDLLERIDALGRLLAHDRILVEHFRADQQALADARRESGEAQARQAELAAQLGERRAELASERAGKQALLESVRSDRAREHAALEELEGAAHALEDTLAKLGAAPAGATPAAPALVPFASLRGQLPAPVDAPVVRGFGRQVDAEFHTQVLNKGVDFGAPLGADVRAVAAGRVRFAGWFRGYGRLVILDHGDRFYTVSGHLGDILVQVDDEVAAGQVIGTVGDTGSLSGPGLYFEIRAGGDAVDPVSWLRGVARDRTRPAG
ncbi:MAG TPA: peptidoglycan DD-metalloendopeptidase family protein [Myxococcota bacterium]|nr:peptidoglycan DD-metalloendopeptidase family protein [Myxococcota bacterium]